MLVSQHRRLHQRTREPHSSLHGRGSALRLSALLSTGVRIGWKALHFDVEPATRPRGHDVGSVIAALRIGNGQHSPPVGRQGGDDLGLNVSFPVPWSIAPTSRRLVLPWRLPLGRLRNRRAWRIGGSDQRVHAASDPPQIIGVVGVMYGCVSAHHRHHVRSDRRLFERVGDRHDLVDNLLRRECLPAGTCLQPVKCSKDLLAGCRHRSTQAGNRRAGPPECAG